MARFPLVLCLALAPAALLALDAVKVDDPKDRQVLEGFLKHAGQVSETLTEAYAKKQAAEDAESYCWVVLKYQHLPLTAYRLSGNEKYLDLFVACFKNLRAAMTQDGQGFWGWYGKPLPGFQDPKQPDFKTDVIISDYRAIRVLAEFVETVDAEPALREKYAGPRAEYLELLEKHLAKKWPARGNSADLGAHGAIFRAEKGLKDVKADLTKPHNKHAILIHGLLALHRVTGKEEYLRTAVSLGVRFKHCLTLKDGHYEWNYWDPAGAWDVHPTDPAKWKHWIGVEHKGGYYSSTLSQAVDLYQHGLVFDRTDLDRFLKTQMEKCWNGDAVTPKWARVDGTTSDKYMQGDYLCGALAPFHEKLETFLYAGARQEERVKNAANSWQGGVVADDWIASKYLALAEARGGKALHAEIGRRFRAKSENAAWLKTLEFDVSGSGYAAPQTPAEMKELPREPGSK